MKAFNLNNSVYVKLTDKGLAIWKAYFEQFDHLPYWKEQREKYTFEQHAKAYSGMLGYHHFQLHRFMEIFGDKLQSENVSPFGDIIMSETDLKDAPETRTPEQFLSDEVTRILLSGKKYKIMGDVYEDVYPEIAKKYGEAEADRVKNKILTL